jgi:hypothetical protein
MTLSRRGILLAGAALGVTATGIAKTARAAVTKTGEICTPKEIDLPKGKIFALGRNGQRHTASIKKYLDSREKHSILTEIDIHSGKTKYTPVPVMDAHYPLPLKGGHVLCVGQGYGMAVLDKNREVVLNYTPPSGFVCTGHAIALPEKNIFLVATRNYFDYEGAPKDTGRIGVFDLDTFQLKKWISTGGLYPHEFTLMPDGKEIAVSHYGGRGSTVEENLPHFFKVTPKEPKVTILDVETLKPVREYSSDLNAVLTHISINAAGEAIVTPVQSLRVGTKGQIKTAIRLLKEEWNVDANNIPYVQPDAFAVHQIYPPTPLLKINLYTGKQKEILVDNSQCRAQSTACNMQTGALFATYVHHHTLKVLPKNGKPLSVSTMPWGIQHPRGVTDIPGTPYIAVSGEEHGIAIVHAETFEKVKYYDVPLFRNTHLSTLLA